MSNYTRQKFRLGTVWGQTGGRSPDRPLELPLVVGDWAYVARGGNPWECGTPKYVGPCSVEQSERY